ncbi:hypothetical protein DY000_02008827 [Brassica cretica]|uniref:Uncharacterized protein n=1 Tax=Brassica cretica TaxID=69181 RepID=A0ABQ7C051_BRACR|nr:hypothetical protein DY000_02008827 [Brassica cretica]
MRFPFHRRRDLGYCNLCGGIGSQLPLSRSVDSPIVFSDLLRYENGDVSRERNDETRIRSPSLLSFCLHVFPKNVSC